MKHLKIINSNKNKLVLNKQVFIKSKYKNKLNSLILLGNVLQTKNNYKNNLNTLEINSLNSIHFPEIYTAYISENLEYHFYQNKYSAFDSYLTCLELANLESSKIKFSYKYKYSLLTKFLPFLIKNGKKIQTINATMSAMSSIYFNLNQVNSNNLSSYLFINEFKHYIFNSLTMYNINYLLNWIITIYRPVFDIKAFNVPKINKKKSDKSVLFKIVYLPDKNRVKVAFKHLGQNIKKNEASIFDTRISNTFLDILLNYKKSYLYTRKMYIYEQVMEL